MGKWMFSRWRVDLDPLDLEILERALEGAVRTMKEKGELDDLESDADLEAALCAELIEIARSSGLTDAEALRDAALALAQNVAEEGVNYLSHTAATLDLRNSRFAAAIGAATD